MDDCSKDNTRRELAGLPVYYLRHRINMGQGAALQTGIDFARKKEAAYYVTFDADGQHDAEDIKGMFELLKLENRDIIFGSRFLPGARTNVSLSRSVILNIARYINYFVSGILLSDAYNGLRLFNSLTASRIRLTENKMAHATQIQILVAKNKLKYEEFPVSIRYTSYTKGKGLRNMDGLKIFFEIFLYKIFR